MSLIFRIVDDAGNVVILDGDKDFFITNDTRVRNNGGGGSLNFGNIKKKSTFQTFTPNQTKEFHDKVWKSRKKSRAQMRLESLRRRLARPVKTKSRIQPKPLESILEKRRLLQSRLKAMARDGQPKKLQKGLERVVFRGLDQEKVREIADDTRGEFRLQSTLNNLKSKSKSALKKTVSRRHTGINKSGRYLRIKYKD